MISLLVGRAIGGLFRSVVLGTLRAAVANRAQHVIDCRRGAIRKQAVLRIPPGGCDSAFTGMGIGAVLHPAVRIRAWRRRRPAPFSPIPRSSGMKAGAPWSSASKSLLPGTNPWILSFVPACITGQGFEISRAGAFPPIEARRADGVISERRCCR